MPVIGNLAEFPLPEVLHFIGSRTGRMKLLDVPGTEYMELDIATGYLCGLHTSGVPVEDPDRVLTHLSHALQASRGMFEFTILEPQYIRGSLQLPLQSLAMEMAYTVDQMNHETQKLFQPTSRFTLLQDPQVWLELELRQFFHYAREMIYGQATLHEIADYLGMEEHVTASHLSKLRALGIVDLAPEMRRTTRVPLPKLV